MPAARKTARGHISQVQEDRFRLISETGQGVLFTLAHNASTDAGELRRFYEIDVAVVVEYEGAPDLDSGVAHAVRLAPPRKRQGA